MRAGPPPPTPTLWDRSYCAERVTGEGRRGLQQPCRRWRQDHNSSRPLAVLLTLDRPSLNPASVILEVDSQGVASEPKGARPRPLEATRRASDPAPQPPPPAAQVPPRARPLGPPQASRPAPAAQARPTSPRTPARRDPDSHLLRLHVLLVLQGQLQVRVVTCRLELVAREHEEGEGGTFHQELGSEGSEHRVRRTPRPPTSRAWPALPSPRSPDTATATGRARPPAAGWR